MRTIYGGGGGGGWGAIFYSAKCIEFYLIGKLTEAYNNVANNR